MAITASQLEQGRQFVPGLPCSNLTIAIVSVMASISATAFSVLLAHVIGFPVPYIFISCSPVYCSTLAIIGIIKWGKRVRASKPIQHALISYIKVMSVQMTLTFIYPAFNYLFNQQTGLKQTAVAMTLASRVLALVRVQLSDALGRVLAVELDLDALVGLKELGGKRRHAYAWWQMLEVSFLNV